MSIDNTKGDAISQKNMSKRNPHKSSNMEDKFKLVISTLSYEETLKALDALILELRNEEIPLEKLEESYLKGKLYLSHCEDLLSKVEQRVMQLDPVTLEKKEA